MILKDNWFESICLGGVNFDTIQFAWSPFQTLRVFLEQLLVNQIQAHGMQTLRSAKERLQDVSSAGSFDTNLLAYMAYVNQWFISKLGGCPTKIVICPLHG